MDRIFIRENDYYLLQVNDDVDLIPMNHWEKESKKKREGPSVAATWFIECCSFIKSQLLFLNTAFFYQ